MNFFQSTLLFLSDHSWVLALAKGSLVLAVTALVFAGARWMRWNAAARHALLLAGCGAALVVPLWSLVPVQGWQMTVETPVAAFPAGAPATQARLVHPKFSASTPSAVSVSESESAPVVALPESSEVQAAAPPAWHARLSASQVALWLWLAGASIILLPLGVAYARLAYQASRARMIKHSVWNRWVDQEAACHGIRHPVGLCVLPEAVLAPATFGFGRWTRIALPQDALTWPESEMRLLLAHELAHVQRRDWLGQLAGQVMLAVYWFNPVAWWMLWRMGCEAEFACDNQVVASGVRATAYADCMVQMAARMVRAAQRSAWTQPSMPFVSFLSRRVVMVMEMSESRRALGRVRVWGVAAAALLIAALVGSTQVARAQQTQPKKHAQRAETKQSADADEVIESPDQSSTVGADGKAKAEKGDVAKGTRVPDGLIYSVKHGYRIAIDRDGKCEVTKIVGKDFKSEKLPEGRQLSDEQLVKYLVETKMEVDKSRADVAKAIEKTQGEDKERLKKSLERVENMRAVVEKALEKQQAGSKKHVQKPEAPQEPAEPEAPQEPAEE